MTLDETDDEAKNLLAVSTEDGRILFYDTAAVVDIQATGPISQPEIPALEPVCQLGGATEGFTGRVKDFEILKPPDSKDFFIITGSSDGAVRLWAVDGSELVKEPLISRSLNDEAKNSDNSGDGKSNGDATKVPATRQVGLLLGTYEAGNRITCLKAFIMSEPESLRTNGLKNGIAGKHGEEADGSDEDRASD